LLGDHARLARARDRPPTAAPNNYIDDSNANFVRLISGGGAGGRDAAALSQKLNLKRKGPTMKIKTNVKAGAHKAAA